MTGLGALERLGRVPQGIVRFDLGRDLRAVIALLELGFHDDLEARDRRWLAELSTLSRAGPALGWLMRLAPSPSSGFDGFVCYQDGRLIGNVSLMRSSREVWIIANVVTHPQYRRRGIAFALLEQALDSLERRGARQVQLQVRADNLAAHELYAGFGFWPMNSATTLRLAQVRRSTRVAGPGSDWALRSVSGRASWQMARRLLARSGALDRGGPTSLAVQALEHHWLWDGLEDWMQGRSRQTWAALVEGEYRGLVSVLGLQRQGPHRLDLVIDPRWMGRVERTLIDVALQGLAPLEPFEVECEIDARHTTILEALAAAGFRTVRTLDRLACDLDAAT